MSGRAIVYMSLPAVCCSVCPYVLSGVVCCGFFMFLSCFHCVCVCVSKLAVCCHVGPLAGCDVIVLSVVTVLNDVVCVIPCLELLFSSGIVPCVSV